MIYDMDDSRFRMESVDALRALRNYKSGIINCCITSPPYFGLRDYGVEGQIGTEETPQQFIDRLVPIFTEVKRVLRDDGTLWVNIGDTQVKGSLLGIPWMLASALREDGWLIRSEIIWHKTNPMPESVKNRPTKAHEPIFLLSKSESYYYNKDAIAEPARYGGTQKTIGDSCRADVGRVIDIPEIKNARDVWSMSVNRWRSHGKHYAIFPPELPKQCMLAGCPEGGVVLDPFSGTGTTGIVALEYGRRFLGIELNRETTILFLQRYFENPANYLRGAQLNQSVG